MRRAWGSGGLWKRKRSDGGELTYSVFTNAVGGVEGASHQAGGGG